MADLIAPLPLLTLRSGAQVRFEAIDPSTGAPVASVALTAAHLWAAALDDGEIEPPDLPVFLWARGD